ncbi:MAG: hypothetical protein MJ193_04000, partial [Clostridia bacterium]|nr:hypothetical protein [Clostridia bacterium]
MYASFAVTEATVNKGAGSILGGYDFSDYVEAFNIETGEIKVGTIGAKLELGITISSAGYTVNQPGYDQTFINWAVDLLGGLLGGLEIGGAPLINAYTTIVNVNEYYGTIYRLVDGEYIATTRDYALAHTSETYYKSSIVLNLPNRTVEIIISVTADINLPMLLLYGIGGILYSDLQVEINIGAISPEPLLSIAYLGSKRLTQDGNIYKISTNGVAFSDALLIDATGIGLGKINFHGLAGLLGAKQQYPEVNGVASGDAVVAGEADSSASAKNVLALELGIWDGGFSLNVDSTFIFTLLDILGLDLGDIDLSTIPVQKIAIALNFDIRKGFENLNIEVALDSVGTMLAIGISGLEVSVGNKFVDTENLAKEAQTGYAGLSLSNTAGTSSLIQNILDNLAPALDINLNKKTWAVTTTNIRRVTGENQVVDTRITGLRDVVNYKGQDGYRIKLGLAAHHPNSNTDNHLL